MCARLLIAIAVVLGCVGALPAVAVADTYTVDTGVDGAPSAARCTDGTAGNCSLRDAVQAANEHVGADVIEFSAAVGTITLTEGGADNSNAAGDLDVTEGAITIRGRGANTTIINAVALSDRILQHISLGSTTIEDLTLAAGGSAYGGCMLAESRTAATPITLRRVIFDNCRGTSAGGAAVFVGTGAGGATPLVIEDSWFMDNATTTDNTTGGALSLDTIAATVNRSTFSGNHQVAGAFDAGAGGAINQNGGSLDVRNSTFHNNRADGEGSAIESNASPVTIRNSTFFQNDTNADSTGVAFDKVVNATVSVGNSIFLANTHGGGASDAVCAMTLTDLGGNLVATVGIAAACGLSSPVLDPSNTVGSPTFGPAGGVGDVLPIPLASVAVDAGVAALCSGADMSADGRGGTRVVGSSCDIGAYEVGGRAGLEVSSASGPSALDVGQTGSLAASIRSEGPDLARGGTVTLTPSSGVGLSGVTLGGNACSGTGPVTCSLSNLNTGASLALSGTLTGTSASTATVTIAATSNGLDTTSSNDSKTITVTVSALAPPSLTLRGRSFKMSRRGVMSIPARCDGPTAANCTVALSLATTSRFAGKRRWSIACRRASVRTGSFTTIRCTLPTAFRRALKARRTGLPVRLSGTVTVGADRRTVRPVSVTLRR